MLKSDESLWLFSVCTAFEFRACTRLGRRVNYKFMSSYSIKLLFLKRYKFKHFHASFVKTSLRLSLFIFVQIPTFISTQIVIPSPSLDLFFPYRGSVFPSLSKRPLAFPSCVNQRRSAGTV